MWRVPADERGSEGESVPLYLNAFFPPAGINKGTLMCILSGQQCRFFFFSCMAQTAGPKPDSSPVGAPAAINARWKAHLLKWNFALAVRNHLRTRGSWLRRRAFQSCHFARQSWAAFTQTALYPAGSTLSARRAYSPLFIHSFPPGQALPLWRMGHGAAQLFSPDRGTLGT